MSPVEILATDLSPSALGQARTGVYGDRALRRGIDAARQRLCFELHAQGWRVVERVRRRMTFAPANLLDSYAKLGRFDIVFCRNVLIDFAVERRRASLERIGAALAPGGFPVLGGTESVFGDVARLERCRDMRGLVYRRIG